MNTVLSGLSSQNQLLANNLQKHSHTTSTLKQQDNDNDKVSIGFLTPEKTQALLNHEIADKLKKFYKDEGIELKGLKADDFTPEKVSERILGFVSGRILSETDSDKQKELLEQARKGIEQGFAEAREILEGLSVLNGKVKEDADSTYDLIQQGLEQLDKEINGIAVVEDEETKENTNVQSIDLANSFSRNETTRIEIMTNDGDRILIDLFRQQSAQSTQTFSSTEDGSVFSQSRSISASAGLSYQVQGELDEDEQKAIDDLLKDVAKVSDQFFSGNVQQAFTKALELDFDSSELTRFSLDLGFQETRSTAISTYNALQNQGQDQPVAEYAGLKDIGDFIKQMDHLFQSPLALNKLADTEQGIGDLIKGMNQILHSDEMNKLEQGSISLLDSLVHQLKERHSSGSEVTVTDKETLS